jgi:hypothetical protein
MGVPYTLFYRLGFHPWEELAEHPPFADKLAELFAREEAARGASRGDVEVAFPDWEITDVEVADSDPDPVARFFRFDERFYRLGRKSAVVLETAGPSR